MTTQELLTRIEQGTLSPATEKRVFMLLAKHIQKIEKEEPERFLAFSRDLANVVRELEADFGQISSEKDVS